MLTSTHCIITGKHFSQLTLYNSREWYYIDNLISTPIAKTKIHQYSVIINNHTYVSRICQFINNVWTSDEWLVYAETPHGEYIASYVHSNAMYGFPAAFLFMISRDVMDPGEIRFRRMQIC